MNRPAALLDPDDQPASEALQVALAEALAPRALEPPAAAAMRRRLLDRARASRTADRPFTHVRTGDGIWRPLLGGVRVKTLGSADGARSVLVELAAGASLPAHAHHQHEECVVLTGDAQLGDVRVARGDYHVAPAGSRHGRVSSQGGALLYLRGAPIGNGLDAARDLIAGWLPGSGPAPLTVRADADEWQDFAPGVQRKALWWDTELQPQRQSGPLSGPSAGPPSTAHAFARPIAQSMLFRLQPGAQLAAQAAKLDQECLLLDGEAFFGDTLLQTGEYRLAVAGTPQRPLTTDVGALLFVRGAADGLACAAR